MKLRTIEHIDVRGKITDTFRMEQSMPTINALRAGGAKIAICAHLGRPKGTRNMEFSLRPVAEYMGVPLIADCLDKDFMATMHDGDVVLLENVRFYPGEEKNDPTFSADLARGFDIFVNDAFAVSHRAHASTVGVAEILPSYAGLLLASEIENLNAVMTHPARPLTAIVAGSKVSTKIGVLKALAKLSDNLIIGGALGTTFNFALGANVGNSLYEPDQRDTALEILEYARENNCNMLLPLDKGVAPEFTPTAPRTDKTFDEITDADIIMDDGVQTITRNIGVIEQSATVIWNGSVGMAEWQPTWSVGTFALARAIAEQTRAGKLTSVIGGGDTVAALDACGCANDMTYVSTGGGAFLEFIESRTLPGIAVLEQK